MQDFLQQYMMTLQKKPPFLTQQNRRHETTPNQNSVENGPSDYLVVYHQHYNPNQEALEKSHLTVYLPQPPSLTTS